MLYCNLQASDCWLILFRSIRRVFAAITFGSMAVGRSSTQLPDYTKAKLAASNIKKLLARESAIDPMSTDGETPVSWSALVRANSYLIKNNLWEKTTPDVKMLWPRNHRLYRSGNVFKGTWAKFSRVILICVKVSICCVFLRHKLLMCAFRSCIATYTLDLLMHAC